MAAAATKARPKTQSDLAVVPTDPPAEEDVRAPREFRTGKRSELKPITFRIIIEVEDDDPKQKGLVERVEEFHARPTVPGAITLDVAASFTRNGNHQAAAIQRFFAAAIPDEEKDRWAEVVSHPDGPALDELGGIADWLAEQYADPTKRA